MFLTRAAGGRPAGAGARGARLLAARARARLARSALLVEKSGLAALCAFAVTLLMLLALGGFFVELDWARFPQWLLALGAGAVAFARARRRDRRRSRARCAPRRCSRSCCRCRSRSSRSCRAARSRAALYDVDPRRLGAFPFKATLQALDAALNDAEPGLRRPLAHLAALAVALRARARAVGCAARVLGPRAASAVGGAAVTRSVSAEYPRRRDGLPRHPRCAGCAARGGAARPRARDASSTPGDLILPLFVDARDARRRDRREPIAAMPGVERLSIEHAVARGRARRPRSGSPP